VPGLIGRAARRLRAEGPAGLLSAVGERLEDWRDARFDRRFGIDTAFEPGHQPIQIHVFSRIVASLPVATRGWGFVDYGCGKGRALVLAAEHGFARVAGVERVAALHEKAARNLERYRERRPDAPPIALVRGEAAEMAPPEAESLLFFYNPFDDVVLGAVLARLRAAWRERRTDWLLAYRTAVHARLLHESDWLRPVVQRPDFCTFRSAR
jgi:SAM-dependent methyltransferase